MFSAISERKMLNVRTALLIGWLVLIASLFWDPISVGLTDPANTASPFRISTEVVHVQHSDLVATPYPLGARIFWTMIVPLVPLFLMVFGHEAWRRVCPLSLASQIPGYLGLRRHRSGVHRRSGLVRRSIALIDRQSWLARHNWYVQFGMLFTGVTMRLLIINSDRTAMAIALLGVICAAMLTGALWGGKTWCNYICPANVVQRIYTEPGGILESTPHFSRPAIPQSMCRKPSPKGAVSACVGCMVDCGDIDLQKSYWNGILEPQRRHVYYMFFGLVVGFYGYYFLYSGNWNYYFSGIWTHEDNVRSKLFDPGFFIAGHAIPIPKLIAAPLTLALACALSLALGRLCEAVYRRWRSRQGLSEKLIVHHCLCVATWLSINAFYSFGGRPNLNLLPMLNARMVDIAIFGLTTWWLRRALDHTPTRYQEESMASSLLTELKKLKVNVAKLLDGRKLDDLKANEIYLLSKALPGFSQQQKLDAYRNILDEAVTSGSTASATARDQLEAFRMQMSISEEEHMRLLEELGATALADPETSMVTPEEKLASIEQYRELVSGMVAGRLEGGSSIEEILKQPALQSTINVLRQSLQISVQDHETAVDELVSQSDLLPSKMDPVLKALSRHRSLRSFLDAAEISGPLGKTLLSLLLEALEMRAEEMLASALSILRNFRPGPLLERYAEELTSLCGQELPLLLRQPVPSAPSLRWRDVLPARALETFAAAKSARRAGSGADNREGHGMASFTDREVESSLSELVTFKDPLIRAIGLVICGYVRPNMAREAAEQMLATDASTQHPILMATAEDIAGIKSGRQKLPPRIQLHATVKIPDRTDARLTFEKEYITVGRASDNDIVIADTDVQPYQLAICLEPDEVRLLRLDSGSALLDGQPLLPDAVPLPNAAAISLNGSGESTPRILVDWNYIESEQDALGVRPILRLAMLARNERFRHFPLEALATLAADAVVGRYTRNASLDTLLGRDRYLLIQEGQVKVNGAGDIHDDILNPGDVFSSNSFAKLFPGSLEVLSSFSVIIQFPATNKIKELLKEIESSPPKISTIRGEPFRSPNLNIDSKIQAAAF